MIPIADPATFIVTIGGRSARCRRPQAFQLIRVLSNRPGRVFPREELLDLLKVSLNASDRAVDEHARHARAFLRKLTETEMILSMRGIGFYWRDGE